jgi:copper chaperone CopZ
MHPHGQSSQNLPQKVYTIKPGETDNFKSIGHQLAYEKGMEIKKEVESLGKSLIELDGKQGVDRNPEKGFVTLGGKEQIHEGRVEFDPKSLDLKRVSLHDNAEDVQYNKTVHKDRTEYSKDEGTGKDIFIEYKDTGEMKFLKQEKLAKRE